MSSMFSSPSKTAQTTSQADQNIANNATNTQLQQEAQLRAAIPSASSNSYFGAAATLSPSSNAVKPSNTQSFGQTGLPPGLVSGGGSGGATRSPQSAPIPNGGTNGSFMFGGGGAPPVPPAPMNPLLPVAPPGAGSGGPTRVVQ